MLGLPFALVQSGYVGLVLLVLSAWVCNHTGRILVDCLYEEELRWDLFCCYLHVLAIIVDCWCVSRRDLFYILNIAGYELRSGLTCIPPVLLRPCGRIEI